MPTLVLLRQAQNNTLKGIGLGLFIATAFTAWITFLRLTSGTAPFDRLDTTYAATVELYYAGGFIGGMVVGLLFPLRQWLLGSAALGVLGVFPLYFGVALVSSRAADAFTTDNLVDSAVCAFLVGGPLGTWAWLDQNRGTAGWLEELRRPSGRTAGKVWIAATLLAAVSYFGVSRWTGHWPAPLIILVAFLGFVAPLAAAVLVTIVWTRMDGK